MGGGGGGHTPSETVLDTTLANISQAQYNEYVKQYVPMQKYAISQNTNPASAIRMAQDQTNANYAQQASNVYNKVADSQGAASGGSGTGRQLFNLGYSTNDLGTGAGLAEGNTGLQSQRDIATNLQNLMAIGNGQSSSGISNLSGAASFANQQSVMDAQSSLAARSALNNAAGGLAGAAWGAYMPIGNQQNNNTNQQPGLNPPTY